MTKEPRKDYMFKVIAYSKVSASILATRCLPVQCIQYCLRNIDVLHFNMEKNKY